MDIHNTEQIDQKKWDDFLNTANRSNPHQLWGWKNIFEESFGLKAHYFTAQTNGTIHGVLPMLHVKSPIFGNYLTSMPGGIVADDEDASMALIETATELADQLDVQYLALRDSYVKWDSPMLLTTEDQCTFELDLVEGKQKLRKNITRTTRQKANQAKRASVTSKIGTKNIEDYYPIYQTAMRQLGTPTYGLTFFKRVIDIFASKFNLILATKDEQILGGGFVFEFADTLFCTWSGLLKDFYPLNTSYLLYWETIEYAFELETRKIDLGRCNWNSGAFEYKKQWGGKPVPLYQQYYLNKVDKPPSVGYSRENSFLYKFFTYAWQYIPLPITEFIGPKLRKQVPFG